MVGNGRGTFKKFTPKVGIDFRPDRDTMLSVAAGWHTHLGILQARLDGSEPPGFWRTHTRLESEYAQRIPAG